MDENKIKEIERKRKLNWRCIECGYRSQDCIYFEHLDKPANDGMCPNCGKENIKWIAKEKKEELGGVNLLTE